MKKIQNQLRFKYAKPNHLGRLVLTLVCFAFISFLCVEKVEAITLDKAYYTFQDPIYTTSSNFSASIVMYNVDTGTSIFSRPNYSEGENLDFGGDPGNYSVVEVSPDSCYGQSLLYADCLLQPEFLEEARFTIVEPGGGSIPNTDGSVVPSSFSYAPTITFTSPGKNTIFSRIGTIKYAAADLNDTTQFHKDNAGLVTNPVTLSYSDKLGDNVYTFVDPKLKLPIAKGLLASSTYDWSTSGLIPGNWYRIIAEALDMEGLTGQTVSDPFTVDLTPPVFTVSTDPQAVRKGTVIISIEASKDLAAIPTVTVKQNGGKPVALDVTGYGSQFKGTYTVIDGYDGTARILVSGSDAAGNLSSTTVSGGTFSVGVNPPNAPVILFPTSKSAVAEDHIDVKGTARDDTRVILTLNGADVAEAKPDADGNFIFKNVVLDKTKNHGLNYLSVASRDALGVVGPASDVSVKLNTSPTITLIKPTQDEVVSDEEAISVKGDDENGDSLFYTYQIQVGRAPTETSWTSIGDNVPSSGFVWNATEVDDGEYSLRVIADDGYAKATSSIVRFTVRNTVPFFRFEDGRKTVTKSSNPTIVGRALSSNNVGVRAAIDSAEYSLNRGAKWLPLKMDSNPPFSERRFSLALTGLKEGSNPILFRLKDSRGTTGKAVHPVIVDTIAPTAPSLSSIRDGAFLSGTNDENANVLGMQTSLSGTAEPGSIVTLHYDGSTTTVKTLANGIFRFTGLTFMNRGLHKLDLTATDEAGNMSKQSRLSLTYDNPPVITLINPKPFHGLSGQTQIKWSIKDVDGDQISDTNISYRIYGGAWKTVATKVGAIGEVPFDATNLPQANDYELRITTTDGIIPVTLIISFSVDDVLPSIESLTVDSSTASGISASGSATDNASGIESVEYSLNRKGDNNEASWYRALVTKGFGTTRASYSIRYPLTVEDDNYVISARAIDTAGNISKVVSRDARVDRTAPRIGSFILKVNDVSLPPDNDGVLSVPVSRPFQFGISMESDTKSASLILNGATSSLARDLATGLWALSLPEGVSVNTSRLAISAEDEVGNKVVGVDIGKLNSLEPGIVSVQYGAGVTSPLSDANIRVLKWNEDTQSFSQFITSDGSALSVDTDSGGAYSLALPQGRYRLFVTASGMKTLVDDITMDRPSFITNSFETEPISGLNLWIQSIVDWFR